MVMVTTMQQSLSKVTTVPGASTGGAMALMKAQSICGRLFGTKLVAAVGPDTTAMHASVCCKISCL